MRILIAVGSQGREPSDLPWEKGDPVLCLGEIENMPGHLAVATKDGKVHWGWHPDNFREPTGDEL